MPVTIAGMASSHAYTFWKPALWEERRARTRSRFTARYGVEPREAPLIANETLTTNEQRFRAITDRLANLKQRFEAFAPDVLILLGDDQDEHYREHIPQFAIYTGERLVAIDRDAEVGAENEYRNHTALAQHLYADFVESGFDVLESRAFASDRLMSHAHAQILGFLAPTVPVLPIFLNAIHVPAPTPERCFAFGEALRHGLATWPGSLRAVVYASGGLSHFSAGFPYPKYAGPYTLGSIAEEFDRQLIAWMRCGENARLATLSSSALLDHGEVELRQWIALLGVMGDRKPEWLVYEPFYRAIMGMGVGCWAPFDLDGEPGGTDSTRRAMRS